MVKNKLPSRLRHYFRNKLVIKSELVKTEGNRRYYSYQLWSDGKLIFDNKMDYSPSPMDHVMADENYLSASAIYGLLEFLTAKPGDTDSDYFKDYTPEQLEWVESEMATDIGYICADVIYEKGR